MMLMIILIIIMMIIIYYWDTPTPTLPLVKRMKTTQTASKGVKSDVYFQTWRLHLHVYDLIWACNINLIFFFKKHKHWLTKLKNRNFTLFMGRSGDLSECWIGRDGERQCGAFNAAAVLLHSLHEAGKWRFSTSLALDGRLSGKFTSNSTMRSPLCSGFLGKGSPCPATVFLIPGLMTSVIFILHVFPSIVETVTEQPHNDWNQRNGADGKKISHYFS